MHKLFLIYFSLYSITSFSQERVDSELPKIVDTISTIKKATGWIKNDVGKWISKPNAILYESSDLNSNCIDFIEYSLLKISYKNENYFCIIHKSNIKTDFILFDYFISPKINLFDTMITLSFKPVCEGYSANSIKLKRSLINEIYKEFQSESSLAQYDNLQINISINKTKGFLRFFISSQNTILCGDEENSFEKRYFETSLSNLPFFQSLITAN